MMGVFLTVGLTFLRFIPGSRDLCAAMSSIFLSSYISMHTFPYSRGYSYAV
jgi:hypothetical protein